MKKEDEKADFCLNSRRWIETMMMFSNTPPDSCPYQSDNFCSCGDCGYYELRKVNNYLKRFRKIMGGE